MVDSVSGSQRQTPLEAYQEKQRTGELQELEKVSAGYDQSNTVSYRTGGDYIQLPPGSESEQAPSIPGPNYDVTATPNDINGMRVHSLTSQARSGLTSSIELLERTQPELVTPELAAHVREVEGRLSAIESAPEGQLKSILGTATRFGEEALAGTLDADKLQQIMMELEGKMVDNSIKYSEIELKSKAADAERVATSNIKDIREYIEKSNDDKALFGLKIALAVLFPPLGVWEAVQAIDREVTRSDSGLSMFSSSQARGEAWQRTIDLGTKEHWEKKGEDIAWGLGFNPNTGMPATAADYRQRDIERSSQSQGTTSVTSAGASPTTVTDTPLTTESPSSTSSDKPVETAYQGLEVAQGGLTQAEYMKLLQKLQQSEENKEKLQEAIAALESGNPKAAAEILGGLSDQLGMESSLGDSTTTDTTLGQQPQPQIPQQPETAPPLSTNEQQEARSEARELLDRLDEVSDRAQSAEETSIRQQGLIARHSRRA